MKIALLITGLGMGGAERQVCDLADRFAQKGHQVLLVYLTGEAVMRPKEPSIPIVGMEMEKTVWSFFRTYMRLRSLLRKFQPDVLHSHMVHANLLARLLRLSMHIPRLICTAHSTNEGGRLRMLCYRLTDFLADLTTNVSQAAVAAFLTQKAAAKGKIIPLYNGIDTDRFSFQLSARKRIRAEFQIPEETKILLAVGSLTPPKDYPNLFHAIHLLHQSTPDMVLWVVGDGELEHSLKKMVTDLKLGDIVRFLGLRRDIPDIMSAADLFCLSSSFEGFGLVVAEAMGCERVVVATDCGGVKEVLGDSGFLVPPDDSDALAKGISDALSLTDQSRHTLGRSARQRVCEHFSLDATVRQWFDLYNPRLGEHS